MKNNLSIAERNKIVVENMHIVRIIARQYYIHSYLREDLEQEGYLGLIVAAEHYNQEQGVRFDSYASWWVRRYIEDAIRKYGEIVSIPRTLPIAGTCDTIRCIEEILEKLSLQKDEERKGHERELAVQELIEKSISELSVREQMIVRYSYGLGVEKHGKQWIAAQLSISETAVRKSCSRAMRKLTNNVLEKFKKM